MKCGLTPLAQTTVKETVSGYIESKKQWGEYLFTLQVQPECILEFLHALRHPFPDKDDEKRYSPTGSESTDASISFLVRSF